MKNELRLMGFKPEKTEIDMLYNDYGELTLIYDVTNNLSMLHLTGLCEDVVEIANHELLAMAQTLNKIK